MTKAAQPEARARLFEIKVVAGSARKVKPPADTR